ncbi:hypothetical protein KBZ15_17685 [Cyanobium sp. BA20m-p-22]|uniref:hypothetical protein n=1 Tax=Cyanobium sp. BA20m-p-22 TaxID=2823704 RepID=UPI0020CC5FAA|nr:hypothetical protein [Cyanobium sp. BA20m-p-22]MCP9911719.1 hypothetical protein [Cyanobium sp. BA20m-p-22]
MKSSKHSQIRNTKTLSYVDKPARKPHRATSISSEGNNGFSIVFVLTATLILIAGTTTLLNQSTSAMLGSIFQGQSLQARNVARSGMAYLISLLNKKENRHLLALKDSQVVNNSEAGDILWTDTQAREHHLNPCKTVFNNTKRIEPPSPDLSELNLGSGQTNSGYFYIGDNGGISKHRNGATQAFRIINRENSKDFKLARLNTDLSLLDDAQNNGSFRLSVEAIVYRNGQSNEVVSSTILQEDFSVIPKGCRLSFGSHQNLTSNTLRGHGNSSCPLNRFELAINRCMFTGLDPDGYGIVVGAGGEGGFIEADGPTIKNLQGMAVNPVYCLSADPTECTAANNSSGNQMERLDIKLPTPPRYPGNWGDEKSAPVLSPCSAAACPSNASGASGSNQLMQYNSTTQRSIFNAAAVTDATQLPSNCTLHRNDIHCIYRGIDLSGSINNLVFVSGKNIRRIRLYFPTAGNVISQSLASGTLTHCKVESCSGPGAFVDNTTDVSFFGYACPYDPAKPNQCGQQDLIIKGSVNQARFFIFAPQATIKIIGTGTATFQGVIWARGLKMKGTTAIPSIPKTGVADVFHLMGILPDENNTFSKSLTGNATTTNLFPWDMVARSTSRYRFFGN